MIGRLFAAFQNAIESLDVFRDLFRDSLKFRKKYLGLSESILQQYEDAVRRVGYLYRKIKVLIQREGRSRLNPPVSSIELLERMFVSLRDQTYKADAEAKNFYIGKQRKEARDSKRRAKALRSLTEDAAVTLVKELQARGAWNEAIVRELGLLDWIPE